MNKISALSLISFDHDLLLESIARYIDSVDEVILGLPADRKTWVGREFEVPESFFKALKSMDHSNKIKIVEEQFFHDGAAPIQNLTRARSIVSSNAAEDSWLLTVDPDETIVNLSEFIQFLRTFEGRNVSVFGKHITILKRDSKQIFVVENSDGAKDDVCLATKKREQYTVNRSTAEAVAFAPVCIINNSWGRSEHELSLKLEHSVYFLQQGFHHFLADLDSSNYKQFKNFNPLVGSSWESISLIDENITSLTEYAHKKLNLLYKQQAWSATSLYARASLFEGKVVGRDATITELKEQHKSELEKTKNDYEARLALQLRNYKELKMQLDAELLANKARRER